MVGDLWQTITDAKARVDEIKFNISSMGFSDLPFKEETKAHTKLDNLLFQQQMSLIKQC